jgi:pyrimidine-specific ribonucleoside hydrolase
MRGIVSLLSAGTLLLCMGGGAAAARPDLRVVVDTDAGSDDIMAIAFLLARRANVRVEAITVANGLAHVGAGARNMARLTAAGGYADIPVYAGRPAPLSGANEFPRPWREQSDTLPGVDLGPAGAARAPQTKSAAAFLAEWLPRQRAASISILALGPLTNLAEAFGKAPRARAAIREIVIMGGAVRVEGNLGDGDAFQTANKTAEWNIFVDPVAAQRVFSSGVPIRLVPLDATNKVKVDVQFLREFEAAARSPLGRIVAQVLAFDRPHIEAGYFYAWDPLAAVTLVDPAVVRTARLHIDVAQRGGQEGRTVEQGGVKPNAQVAVDADGARFRRTFFAALAPGAAGTASPGNP